MGEERSSEDLVDAIDQELHRLNSSTQHLNYKRDRSRRSNLNRARIAVVDDESDLRLYGAAALASEGYLATAINGSSAEVLLDPDTWEGWDVVLLDYMMPVRGDEVAKLIKKHHPEVKVVVATAWPFTKANFPVELAGYELLRKPFTVKELTDLIERLLAG